MKRLTRFVLIVLPFLGGHTLASDAPAALTAEQYYQRAQALNDEQLPEIDWVIRGMVADKELPEDSPRYLAVQEAMNRIKADVDRAAALDYPPAIYWQSRNRLSAFRGRSEAEAKLDCERLGIAAQQGLLAAAVAWVLRCDPRAKNYNFMGPERFALAEELKKALDRQDTYIAAYPLVLREADCFGISKGPWLPTVDAEGVLKTLREDLSRTLTYDQFRAEAYLFIARNLWNEQSLGYLEKAEALGCRDRFKLRERLEAIKAESARSSS